MIAIIIFFAVLAAILLGLSISRRLSPDWRPMPHRAQFVVYVGFVIALVLIAKAMT